MRIHDLRDPFEKWTPENLFKFIANHPRLAGYAFLVMACLVVMSICLVGAAILSILSCDQWQDICEWIDGVPVDSSVVQPDSIYAEGNKITWTGGGFWKIYIGDSLRAYPHKYPHVPSDTTRLFNHWYYCEVVADPMSGQPMSYYVIPDTLRPNGRNSLPYSPLFENKIVLPERFVVTATRVDVERWIEGEYVNVLFVRRNP